MKEEGHYLCLISYQSDLGLSKEWQICYWNGEAWRTEFACQVEKSYHLSSNDPSEVFHQMLPDIPLDDIIEHLKGMSLGYHEEDLKEMLDLELSDVNPSVDEVVEWVGGVCLSESQEERLRMYVSDGPEINTLADKVKWEWIINNFDKIEMT